MVVMINFKHLTLPSLDVITRSFSVAAIVVLAVRVVVVVMRGRVRLNPGDVCNHRSGRCHSGDDAAVISFCSEFITTALFECEK